MCGQLRQNLKYAAIIQFTNITRYKRDTTGSITASTHTAYSKTTCLYNLSRKHTIVILTDVTNYTGTLGNNSLHHLFFHYFLPQLPYHLLRLTNKQDIKHYTNLVNFRLLQFNATPLTLENFRLAFIINIIHCTEIALT